MTAEILDGRKLASAVKDGLKPRVAVLLKRGVTPALATILVGENPASRLYVSMKQKACQEVGVRYEKHELSQGATQEAVLSLIDKLNADDTVHGILVQLPLPEKISTQKIMEAISPAKDVDGFHPTNLGRLMAGDERFAPATPKGIIKLIEDNAIPLGGRDVVVVNHTTVVGKPLSLMLLNREATVTVCHVRTRDLSAHTRGADVVITAAGVPGLIKKDMIKAGAVVVDAGIAKKDGKVVGDAAADVKEKAGYITPVPGGVGPMTVAMVIENTVTAAEDTV